MSQPTPVRLPEFSISSIAAFSSTGYVHRAFGHLVAAKPGSLLVVPLQWAANARRRASMTPLQPTLF